MEEIEGLPERLTDQCADAGTLPALAGWRPIETAPKDGRLILLAGMSCGRKVDTGEWGVATYNRSTKSYNKGWTTSPGNSVNPTHWMPLPPPPVHGE